MKKCVQIVLIILLFSGCTTFKQGWNNFNAYYNTFYNTKQFYNDGLESNLRQIPEINPNTLIRVHPSPSNAGLQDFQFAIERASSILRNHEESRFFLPAIFIIGKSYFYRAEYFSALEKFQELAMLADGELLQEAYIWQGLTYLETSNYAEGIRVLESIPNPEDDWDLELRAELYVVFAQLHSALGNAETAIDYLNQSVTDLGDQERKARAYFLLAQLYENLGYHTGARNAYREIPELRVPYEIEYHAKRKEAVVLRRTGNYEESDRILRRLFRDSKFDTYRDELQYEIARTKHLSGDYIAGLTGYQEVLDDRFRTPGTVVRAKTYYGMAEIYRDYLNDYAVAADYFERAATQRADPELLPTGFDAVQLAESFGRYAGIKRELAEKDSLLSLAAMSDEELKSFIEELQRAEQVKLEEERRELQRQQDRVLVADQSEVVEEAGLATEFGFLNINDRTRLLDASLQFQARWGDRALSDNWRRGEAVVGSRYDQIVLRDDDDEEIELSEDVTDSAIQAFIQLSDIPFSEEEQLSLRREIEGLNYQLANVFFLTLEMPDSAEVYYRRVIESDLNRELVTMSYYSLAELALYNDEREEAEEWYFYLELYNPGSTYTARLADRLGFDHTFSAEQLEEPQTAILYQRLRENREELSPEVRAEEYLRLAGSEPSESISAVLLFDAAGEYMRAAQAVGGSGQIDRIREWILIRDQSEKARVELQARRDSSEVMLHENSLTEAEREYWKSVSDSTFSEPDFSNYFPYRGAYWDSTRSILNRIESLYASAEIMPRVRVLSQELQIPGDTELDQDMAFEPLVSAPDPTVEPPAGDPDPERREMPPAAEQRERRDDAQTTDEADLSDRMEGIYTIVLYSFSSERLAQNKTKELVESAIDRNIYICPRVINETDYWRVSIGSFTNITSAIRSSRVLAPPYDSQNFISSINLSCVQVD